MVAWLTEDIQHELASINDAAATQNYQISVIIDEENESSYVAVAEQTDGVPPSGAIHGSPVKGWGTFIFRPGLADSFAVEVPRPLFERRSFEFGVNLFQRPSAAAILIAGAHPRANLDGTSDISKAANRVNLFNLVRHVLLRQLGDRPLLIAQARAIQAPVRADIVIATDDGARSVAQLSPLKDRLVRQLTDDQLSTLFVDGGKETAGYELGILMQAASVQVSQNKEVISLWLSPALRSKFREQTENLAMAAQFQACGIVSVEQKLVNYLHTLGFSLGDDLRGDALPKSLRHELIRYCQTSDIVRLAKIVNEYPQWRFVRVIDGPSGQAFLTIRKDDMKFPTLLNLSGAFDSRTMIIKTFHRSTVQSFVKSRTRWMTSESSDPTALANQIVLDVDGEVDRPHGGVQ